MSTAQTVEMYKILNRYFKNEEDATRIVSELQVIIDDKFEERKSELATKQDLNDLRIAAKQDLNDLRIATKQDLNDMRVDLINKLNDHFKWTVATLLTVGAFIVALIKLI